MSLATMVAELRGSVPNYSSMLARTHLRESWTEIRNMRGWSFQLGNLAFATPGAVNQGAVTTVLGSDQVIGNAAATTAWLTAGNPFSLLSMRQFRVGASTIYNIIAYDDGQTPYDSSAGTGSINYPFATLTLNRPYLDLTVGAGCGYTIYQCYYPVPVRDFEAWEGVCDVTNCINLNCSGSYSELQRVNRCDMQRQIFSNPGTLLPYQVDDRIGSSTLGWMMYELYPQPQAQYVYQAGFSRLGADLNLPGDTLPFPITEDVVKTKARVKAYEWAEANKSPSNPRGAGADYRFLLGAAQASAQSQIHEIRMSDRDRVDMWKSTMSRLSGLGPVATFNPATGTVSARNL